MDGGTDTVGSKQIRTTTLPRAIARSARYGPLTAAALAVIGTVLLAIAAQRDRLWWLVLWFCLGTVALAAALLYVNDRLADWLESNPGPRGRLFGGSAICFAMAAAGLVALVVAARGVWLAAVLVLIAAQAAIGMFVAASAAAPDDPPPPGPWWDTVGAVTWGGAGVMIAASLVVGLRSEFGAVGWLMVVVWIVGLATLKVGIVPFLRSRHGRLLWPVVTLLCATVLGLALIAVGAVTSNLLVMLLGVTLAIGALSVVGLAAVYGDCPPARSTWMIVIGAVGIVAGTVAVVVIVHGWQLGVVVAAFVWGVGTWYVFRGEGIVVLLLVGFVAVYGIVDRSADAAPDPHPGSDVKMLALGDSFISGEGAREFLDGTNEVGVARPNQCRRAATAYPYLVADRLGYGLDFVACQGARMRDLTRCAQMATGPVMSELGFGSDELEASDGFSRCTPSAGDLADEVAAWRQRRAIVADDEAGYLPQLANFTEAEMEQFDVVLLSISGNDSGFSTIVKSCLLPQQCSDQSAVWTAKVAANRADLRELYALVRALVRDDTPVIVVPYPRMVSGEACGLGLSQDEHEFVTGFIDVLDGEIRTAAADAGVNFFEPSIDSFGGVQLCNRTKGANHLRLEPTEGWWLDRYQPSNWIHGSMHPNEVGHARIADLLAPYVETLLADVATGDAPANPDPLGGAGAALTDAEEQLASEADDLLADSGWIVDDLYGTVWWLLGPLFVLLASGVVFAAGLVRKDLGLANALRPRDAPPPG